MKLYHLLDATHALDDIRRRQLKVSLISDLNDPFELHSIRLPTSKHRSVWRGFVRDIGKRFGVLCFSRSWDNPMLWSHYADKHRGICLGFDVSFDLAKDVSYRNSMLPFTLNLDHPSGGLGEKEMQEILFTKYSSWAYEEEMRVSVRLENPEPGGNPTTPMYFADFGPQMRLCEVIVGVRSKVSSAEINSALEATKENVKLIKARLAFNSFRVIRNKLGFSNTQKA